MNRAVTAPAPHALSRLQLLAAAALFSTGGAAIKACTLTSWQVTAFRSVVAAVAVLLFLPGARQRWTPRILAVGAAYAATMILFVTANKLTTAANSIFLQSAAPLYIVLLGPRLLGEHMRARDVFYMIMVALGLAMFFIGIEPSSATAPHPLAGNVVATLSGVSWAFTVLGFRWLARAEHAGSEMPTIVAGNAIACVACLPWALPIVHSTATDWMVVGYLGVFQIGLAYLFMASAIRHVPALEASLLLLLEPLLNPLWAWLIQGERPGVWSLCGGALILLATIVKGWVDGRVAGEAAKLTRADQV